MKAGGFVVLSAVAIVLLTGLLCKQCTVFAAPWMDLKEKQQFRDYVINIFLPEDGDGKVVISQKGVIVLELRGENMSHFNIVDLNSDKKQKAALRVSRDITGRGIPNLVILEWTGGAHCCFIFHVFELGETFRQIASLDVSHAGLSRFEDLDNDGKLEFVTADCTFAYWKASFAESPAPKVILTFRDGLYRLAGRLMQKPAPVEKILEEKAGAVSADEEWKTKNPPVSLWATMLDLIYTGNADVALEFFEKAWPADISGKEDFLEKFLAQLKTSPYWVEIRRLNAASQFLR